MSRRGGGRRQGSRRDQQPQPPPSFQRGGRGQAEPPAASTFPPLGQPSSSAPASAPPRPQQPAPARAAPHRPQQPVATPGAPHRPQQPVATPAVPHRPQQPVATPAAPHRPQQPGAAPAASHRPQQPAPASQHRPQQAAAASSSSAPPPPLHQELEEKLALSTPAPAGKLVAPPSSSKAIKPPARPGFGTVGRKVIVRANHFLVEVADTDLHHYDVTISPEVTSKRVNREVISQLVTMYRASHLGNRIPAYDGSKSIFTAGVLPFESKEFVVKLPDKAAESSSSGTKPKKRDRSFKVTIKFASKADIHHLRQFLGGRQADAPLETIQALDVVLRAAPSEQYTVVGRSFFHPSFGTGDIGDGMEYWRGYYQSLRPTQMGLSLNVDVSARSFYEPILVTEFIMKYFNIRDMSRPLSEQDRLKVRKALKGIKVQLTYREYAKSYKIAGVSQQPLSGLTFLLDDKATRVYVVQYFREKYNIALKFTSLPALQSGSDTNPVYLPMELCRIVEGQRYTKKLNERQVTALLRATCQRPQQRENDIKATVRKNSYNRDKLVNNEFGMRVNEELAVVNARVLPAPMLKYHDTGRQARVDPQFGQWNMINMKMINGGTVENWTCLNFSSRVNRDLPAEFCRQLVDMCISKGMEFNPNPILPIRSAQANQIESALKDIHDKCTAKLANQRKQLQLLIIILPDFSGTYGQIKRVCETELGIVSQCCQPRQASKLNKQYFENVALKINVKVGGRNTVLNDAIQRKIPNVTDLPTIIFGADVTHPQPGEDSSSSIAAVVASMDWPEVTKYRGVVSAQTHRQEIIEDLYKSTQDPQKGLVHSGMIRELFIAFKRSTGLKPSRIIFYRDGVSEGQFKDVLLLEIDAIRKACNSLEEGYLPPITFVVVQKRHHTRLFPPDHSRRDQTDRSGNILPGTVVDTQICHPTEFDFYLNSHAGIQGTSKPTHYHVLFDENRFSADALQMLTNNLCYTYARCTRSVSIVPPAYYAHLAAFRARNYTDVGTSDGESSGGRNSRGTSVEVRPLPMVKENVKDVMFYC